jgi:hypothetical protein
MLRHVWGLAVSRLRETGRLLRRCELASIKNGGPGSRRGLDVTNIRRRLKWLAHEYQIAESELPNITLAPTEELCDFIQKYRISYDWLIAGDLKGLHRMTSECRVRRMMTSTAAMNDDLSPPFRAEMSGKEFEAALRTLPKSAQLEIEAKLRQIVEDQKR